MTKTKMTLALAAAMLGASGLMGCSSDASSSSTSSGSSGTTTSGLSAAYQSNCQRCHGARGEGGGAYPSIPGGQSEAGYVSRARAGKGAMPSFDASQISDADLKADYAWLTTQR